MNESTYKLNFPPENAIRVPYAEMQKFVAAVAKASGLVEDRAELIAELLTGNDLRGVFSHGTRQIERYARNIRSGTVNPDPKVDVLREGPTSVVMDGDGGLGYFPMYEGTKLAIEKAKQLGVAVLQTRNHGHIGAAGIYSRMPLKHDMAAFVTAGSLLDLQPGQPVYTPAIGSPVSISAPTGDEPPIVVDFAPVYDLRISPQWPNLADWIPGTIYRCIGLGMIAQSWGGIMAGNPATGGRSIKRRFSAGQCGFAFIFQVSLFIDPAEYKKEMDLLVAKLRELAPLDGFKSASYAGGIEGEREREFRAIGIPVGPDHRSDLETAGHEFGIDVPWD